ncbi:MAG: Glu-tRNA(Gln) amidotransferase GatDE subunit D, partial [Candidatus Methanoperedens sp.]|nr:Glu-tRNA(Gln) amidotransferase GatDE subunit D [Candidatus Methanoperedens sp.]
MQTEIYDKVSLETNGVKYEGTLMPSQTDRIVLKLKNGYNIGIKKESASLKLLDKKEKMSHTEMGRVNKDKKEKLPT